VFVFNTSANLSIPLSPTGCTEQKRKEKKRKEKRWVGGQGEEGWRGPGIANSILLCNRWTYGGSPGLTCRCFDLAPKEMASVKSKSSAWSRRGEGLLLVWRKKSQGLLPLNLSLVNWLFQSSQGFFPVWKEFHLVVWNNFYFLLVPRQFSQDIGGGEKSNFDS